MAGGKLRHHVAYLEAIKRRERDGAVMRTHAPSWTELRARRRHDEQRRQRTSLGKAAEHIERRRIGPMQILEHKYQRLNPCARDRPAGQCRELPSPQLLRRYSQPGFLGYGNVEERREQGDIFRRIELDQRERVLQVCKPPLRRYVGAAETLATPFCHGVQRCVLQELQTTPLCPGMRRLAQPGMKFLDQARFTYSGLANNQHQLPLALPRALPPPHQRGDLFLATNQGREMALSRT